MIPYRLMLVVFVIAAALYVGVGRTAFTVPANLEEAEACGFTGADFAPSGRIEMPATQAWWTSFVRKQEYWNAFSAGLAAAFAAFALTAMRRLGAAVAGGAAVGGGLLALVALCIGCLAPVLSLAGLGFAVSLLAGIPKWLLAVNTLVLTGWATMFMARRLAACPVACVPAAAH